MKTKNNQQTSPEKEKIIRFLLRQGAVTFGNFTTKSGRSTPYFINIGNIDCGEAIDAIGSFYAQTILENLGNNFNNLFGPAYKGIPLVVSTAIALHHNHHKSVTFTFNRKEKKLHGEKGAWIGHRYHDGDRIILIDDVVTAGISIRESIVALQRQADINITGLVVAVDRKEKGRSSVSALTELEQEFGIPIRSMVTMDDIVMFLEKRKRGEEGYVEEEMLRNIHSYRAIYGAEC